MGKKKKKVTEVEYLYPEYIEKYKDFDLNAHKLKMVEDNCKKRYGNLSNGFPEGCLRISLYYEVLAQLHKEIDKLDIINKYKAIVVGHSQDLVEYLSYEEIEAIFEEVIEDTKENYDCSETVGSYIVRNFKNALIKYINNNLDKDIPYVTEENYKIKML